MIRLWDSQTGSLIWTLEVLPEQARALDLSPDGHWIACGGDDGNIEIREVGSGKHVAALAGNTHEVLTVMFGADGNHIISGSRDGKINLWDIKSRQARLLSSSHDGGILAMSLSPDGTRLAASGGQRSIHIWQCQNGKLLLTLDGHSEKVIDLAFSQDGTRLVSAGMDRVVKIWETTFGQELLSIKENEQVHSVAFSNQGDLLAVGGDDGLTLRGGMDIRGGRVGAEARSADLLPGKATAYEP